MQSEYVIQKDGVWRVSGSRVSLDSIVYAFWNGESAETIAQSFPVLKLEQVYGAIAFYLAHRDEIDRYLQQRRADYEAKRQAARDADPMFYQKMAEVRRQLLQTTS
ncbi:MAG: DUF433 domain-containing protein [Acidobacteria bacterium]|nr:DUF433 domain-containing protein [Acidobacteriota bacterium]